MTEITTQALSPEAAKAVAAKAEEVKPAAKPEAKPEAKPKAKPKAKAKAKVKPEPQDARTSYLVFDRVPVTRVIRWMGTEGWMPSEAAYAISEAAKLTPSMGTIRTQIAHGKNGRMIPRNEDSGKAEPQQLISDLTKAMIAKLAKARKNAPAPIRGGGGGGGRYLLFGQPVTAVLRRMGAEGLSIADARGCCVKLAAKGSLTQIPADGTIMAQVGAGKTEAGIARRGAPAKLKATELKTIRSFKGKGSARPPATPKQAAKIAKVAAKIAKVASA